MQTPNLSATIAKPVITINGETMDLKKLWIANTENFKRLSTKEKTTLL